MTAAAAPAPPRKSAPSIASNILSLFKKYGHLDYGEAVTVWQHSQQTAKLAVYAGADDEVVLAAFLHDVGHLPLPQSADLSDLTPFGHVHHAEIAAKWLDERGFSEKITAMIGGHVEAKRYLCATEAGYFSSLSDASQRTLTMQGGPMAQAEARIFEEQKFFKDIVRLRRWDDWAKDVSLTHGLPDADVLEDLIEGHLTRKQRRA